LEQSETIVVRWVEAFNARDLDGMLACFATDVEFHPLRLSGVTGAIRLDREADVGSFCAVNRVDDGVILAAHHYLSDADMIERLGLIP
jgi:hypothetical protein